MRYVIASVVLVALDVLVIGMVLKPLYRPMITNIQGRPPSYRPVFGVLAYALMVLGLNLFVVPNVHPATRWIDSIIYGGGFGLCTYGIYSFTAMSVFNEWSTWIALTESCWGAFVYGASSVASSYF